MPPRTEIIQHIRHLKDQGYENPFDRVRRHYMNEMYKKEERNLILYSTSWTVSGGVGTSIDEGDVHSFMDVIHGLNGDELDIIIHSPGGSPTATEQTVSYLRDKFDDIRILCHSQQCLLRR